MMSLFRKLTTTPWSLSTVTKGGRRLNRDLKNNGLQDEMVKRLLNGWCLTETIFLSDAAGKQKCLRFYEISSFFSLDANIKENSPWCNG